MARFPAILIGVLLLVLGSALADASASYLVARDAADVRLQVDGEGFALVSYRDENGQERRVLVWGAVNARHPSPDETQVAFSVDRSGGWHTFRRKVWRAFTDRCAPYDGPALGWLLTACEAPDGSYWALQAWQRTLPALGRRPTTRIETASELRLSHWTGEPARLEVWQDWKYSARLSSVFGRYTYRGVPVYGFSATPAGHVLDGFGRIVYFDTYNSGYGPGWWRADGFLTHRPTGVFCAVFAEALHGEHGVNRGRGERYRLTAEGPGVTPDVTWEEPALPEFDASNPDLVRHEKAMNALIQSLADTDPSCNVP